MADLDISGDVDVDGTLEADAITVNGTALNTVIAGVTVTNATNAAHVTVADNESTNEENLIPFIEDASATGNVGLESDGDFAYNPSTGTVTATIFKGNIDAVDGDFDGTLEADAMTLNGTAITTTATLSTGISNGNVLVATSGIADNDFLRVDGTSIEGRSASEVLSDIGATTATAASDEATALAIALG
jgi:cytoskeletal protein CcmA (bactofilin family)